MIHYPIFIEPGTDDTAFGVVFPDLPGCFSAGDTLDNPDYAGWIVGVVALDPALLDDTIERVNITLPRRVLRRLDALATARGQSRGVFISDLTLRFARSPG